MYNKIEVLKQLVYPLKDELLVSSCGLISREICNIRDRPENFYVQSAMGATLAIAIGLALNTDKKIVVVIGDGDALMSLGTLVLFNKLKLSNLKLIIIDNNQYESTGKQSSCSDAVDFTKICNCTVYKVESSEVIPPRISLSPKQVKERFMNVVNCF